MTARSIARTSGSSESRAYFGGPCVQREALSLNFEDSKTNGFSLAVSLRVLLVPGITGCVQRGMSSELRQPKVISGFGAFQWLEPILYGAGNQQLYKPFISRFCRSFEEIFTPIDAFDLKLLTGFDVILTPNFSRKNDLTLRRNGSSHIG